MEIKWIEDFIALAQYQSFSRAAEFRNVTQSGFSRRIQSLEQWIGAELIDRSSFPPVLTPAGQLFREVADDILAKLFDTRAIIRTEQRIAGKSLQIAAGHTIALNFLPAWLKALSARLGDVRARVIPYTNTSYFGRCLALLLARASDAPALQLHYESDMAEVLKKLVVEGEGVAWLPKSAITAELAAGDLVPAGGTAWHLQIELRVYRDSSNRSEFLDTLWHHLRAGAAALG